MQTSFVLIGTLRVNSVFVMNGFIFRGMITKLLHKFVTIYYVLWANREWTFDHNFSL